MVSLILITVLNSPHSPRLEAYIKPQDIKGLRSNGNGCLITHKDIDEEVQTLESCSAIVQKGTVKKESSKTKALSGWFAK